MQKCSLVANRTSQLTLYMYSGCVHEYVLEYVWVYAWVCVQRVLCVCVFVCGGGGVCGGGRGHGWVCGHRLTAITRSGAFGCCLGFSERFTNTLQA